MESITNAASSITTAASKAIWGDQTQSTTQPTQGNETTGQEPISGQQGQGTATEPYDQGNSVNPTSTSHQERNNPTDKVEPTSLPDRTSDNNNNFASASSSSNDKNPISGSNPTSNMSETTASNISNNPTNAAAGGETNPLQDTDKTGVTDNTLRDHTKDSDIVPSESSHPGVAPTSGGTTHQKQQGADRPSDAPTGEEESAVKGSKDEAEDALKTRDPNDHSGEPLRVHDGSEVSNTEEARRESKADQPGGQAHGEESKGTGEQWVKTSGLHADGGDFDATKPGAGREADRILEEKGIHRDEGGGMGGASTGPENDKKDKVPLGEKIKNKLHIGHKDK